MNDVKAFRDVLSHALDARCVRLKLRRMKLLDAKGKTADKALRQALRWFRKNPNRRYARLATSAGVDVVCRNGAGEVRRLFSVGEFERVKLIEPLSLQVGSPVAQEQELLDYFRGRLERASMIPKTALDA